MASNWRDVIEGGFVRYVETVDDPTAPAEFRALLADLCSELQRIVKSDDTCSLAFGSMVIRPDVRTGCLVVILQDRVLAVWKKGLFKKVVQSVVVSRSSIHNAEQARPLPAWGLPSASSRSTTPQRS